MTSGGELYETKNLRNNFFGNINQNRMPNGLLKTPT